MARLEEALDDTPVVLIHGPRQCGKTTLAKTVASQRGHSYFTFDDDVVRAAAATDPVRFLSELPERVVLDEVQRAPQLFSTLKAVVDKNRRPGRFLLTGSSNVLLLPQLADSLAGRMAIIRLHPLAQSELERRPSNFLESLFRRTWPNRKTERLSKSLAARIVAGGYPEALGRQSAHRRAAWYRDYIETLVQRDVRELSRISSLDVLPRLLALAASHTARLINITDLGGPFSLSRPTIRDYVTLLERVFLLEELSPWYSNHMSRLVKTPKLHIIDTGVACGLLGHNEDSLWEEREMFGQMLETFVFQELRRQASFREDKIGFSHFRDKDGVEVDIVLEAGAHQMAGVEIKAGSTVTSSDFRGLRKLAEAVGKRWTAGIVLYDGEATLPFGERLHAVPFGSLWQGWQD
ncbi:MAG: ATP-binding protein [Deltaproteobacteria bacterium]|nr:ATP-binding protein [Deltaproteobacteria bacterium]